ncbi:hypothetical protein DICVIV_03607 [Dictyocaulus viviparus]|uniref:Uncharacterized protein n=1 Tax=Dictyocaulus viviparus TaxID=29172 RepID=A0A0D8Y063_DICVI|nr:hypothetical protein DICVIV_03607 [Dictyocaulus viviparus]
MAASNKRKATGSPSLRHRRVGDKITIDEKKVGMKKSSKVVNDKDKLAFRRKKLDSPCHNENPDAVITPRKNSRNLLVKDIFVLAGHKSRSSRFQDQHEAALGNILNLVNKDLKLPEVGRVEAMRCHPRLTDERIEIEVFAKRHEKHEKEEKQVLRRDRIWQNELRLRAHLLRVQKNSPSFRDFRIVVVRRSRRMK